MLPNIPGRYDDQYIPKGIGAMFCKTGLAVGGACLENGNEEQMLRGPSYF